MVKTIVCYGKPAKGRLPRAASSAFERTLHTRRRIHSAASRATMVETIVCYGKPAKAGWRGQRVVVRLNALGIPDAE